MSKSDAADDFMGEPIPSTLASKPDSSSQRVAPRSSSVGGEGSYLPALIPIGSNQMNTHPDKSSTTTSSGNAPPGVPTSTAGTPCSSVISKYINSWEECYDQLFDYLRCKSYPPGAKREHKRCLRKRAEKFVLVDGMLYYTTMSKDKKNCLQLKVIRDVNERMTVIKKFHVDSNDLARHNSKEWTAELVSQLYYWKGIYNDVCDYVNNQCTECSNGRMTNKKPKIAELHMTPSLSSHSTSSANSSPTSGVTLEPAAPDQAPPVTYSIIYSPALGSDSSGGTEMDVEENDNGGKKKNVSHLPPAPINSNANSNTVDLTDETDSAAATTLPHKTTFTMPNGTAFFVPMSTNLTTSPAAAAAAAMLQIPPNMATPLRGSSSPTANNSSIYTDIFGVNKLFVSQTNIQPEVVSVIQRALLHTVDTMQLNKVVATYIARFLELPDKYSVIVTPSRAACYLLSISASMIHLDPLSIHSQLTSRSSRPLAVVHDACCTSYSLLPTLVPLVGGYCWSLGSPQAPMDRHALSSAIASNRIASLVYEPHAYPPGRQGIPLQSICTVCHNSNIAVLVDNSTMDLPADFRNFIGLIKGELQLGVDAIMLPETSRYGGVGHCSILVAKKTLIAELAQSVERLQTMIAIPVTCTHHEIAGTAVALKAYSSSTRNFQQFMLPLNSEQKELASISQ